jgi:hypothetical protein
MLRYAILFHFILVFLLQNSLIAQRVEFGIKGGMNASYFQGTYTFEDENARFDLKPKIGTRYSVGGLIRYNITPTISLQSELFYTTSGVRFREPVLVQEQNINILANITLTYISIPVLFRISTTLPDRGKYFYRKPGFTFNAFTGGLFAYKTNAKFEGHLSGVIAGREYNESFLNSVWDQFTDTDIGFVIGAGFEYGVSIRFTFDMRYVVSLTNIGTSPQFPRNIRNEMVSILVGTVF